MKKQRVWSILSLCFFLLALGLVLSGFADALRYSGTIDKPAGDILSNDTEYFLTSSTATAAGSTTFKFSQLSGASPLGELSVTGGNAAISVSASTGRSRVLAVDTQTEQVVCDWTPEKGDTPMQLSVGEYEIYLVGKWFSGKLLLSHPGNSFYPADA